jgi:hypothetical protein
MDSARDSLSPLLHYFLKRAFGYQRIGQFATERRGVSLQCHEGDIALASVRSASTTAAWVTLTA